MQTNGAVDRLTLLLGTLVVRLYTFWGLYGSARDNLLPLDFGPSLLDFSPRAAVSTWEMAISGF